MAGISGENTLARESYWRSQIATRGQSELSIAAYCRRHKLAVWQYHWWKRELKRRNALGISVPFAEVRLLNAVPERGSGIEVELRGRRRIVVHPKGEIVLRTTPARWRCGACDSRHRWTMKHCPPAGQYRNKVAFQAWINRQIREV